MRSVRISFLFLLLSAIALIAVARIERGSAQTPPPLGPLVTFTGHADIDFERLNTFGDPVREQARVKDLTDPGLQDVGLPSVYPNPQFDSTIPADPVTNPTTLAFPYKISGWDIFRVRTVYDFGADKMYVGVDCYIICGDVDGDGDPGSASPELQAVQANDLPDLAGGETFAFLIDTDANYRSAQSQGGGVPPIGEWEL